jgi:hypothetical protein
MWFGRGWRRWIAGMAALTALGCLTWWLVEGGTRGAEIAGDLAAPAGVIAAAAAIWPFLRPGVPAGRPARTIPKGQISTMATSPASAQAPRRLRSYVPGSGAPPVRRSGQVVLWGPRASGKTCYLAALNTAIAEAVPPWALGGHDPGWYRIPELPDKQHGRPSEVPAADRQYQ